MNDRNIILNIPHSSVNGIFDDKIGRWSPNAFFINECVNKMTDWWTDMLFDVKDVNYNKVIFPYSRFVCDAERLQNDPMEEMGQGIIYTNFNGFERDELSGEEKNVLKLLWETHQIELSSLIKSDDDIIIDCHSFPSEYANVDVCIGFNDDWSYNQKLVDKIIDQFKKSGYSVGVNYPYSNSITPQSEHKYSSVMIEVNKRIYMNEKLMLLETNPRQWMRWYGCIKKVYKTLLD